MFAPHKGSKDIPRIKLMVMQHPSGPLLLDQFPFNSKDILVAIVAKFSRNDITDYRSLPSTSLEFLGPRYACIGLTCSRYV